VNEAALPENVNPVDGAQTLRESYPFHPEGSTHGGVIRTKDFQRAGFHSARRDTGIFFQSECRKRYKKTEILAIL